MIPRLRAIPFHTTLFALYSVLALLSHNIQEVEAETATRALLVSAVASVIVLVAARILLKDWDRAGAVATLAVVLFFTYGHVYMGLKQLGPVAIAVVRHRFLAPAWLVLLAAGTFWALRSHAKSIRLTAGLNLVALVLFALPVVQLATFAVRWQQLWSTENAGPAPAVELRLPDGNALPDIYFIVLDAYARDDVLETWYGLDNTPFLEALEATGFYVARCSQSNYALTLLSLASTLNFEYLHNLDDRFTADSDDRSPLWPLVRSSRVRQALEAAGYTVVAFETGFYWSQLDNADVFLGPFGVMDAGRLLGCKA